MCGGGGSRRDEEGDGYMWIVCGDGGSGSDEEGDGCRWR